jgi:hypothetical protein
MHRDESFIPSTKSDFMKAKASAPKPPAAVAALIEAIEDTPIYQIIQITLIWALNLVGWDIYVMSVCFVLYLRCDSMLKRSVRIALTSLETRTTLQVPTT